MLAGSVLISRPAVALKFRPSMSLTVYSIRGGSTKTRYSIQSFQGVGWNVSMAFRIIPEEE